MALDLSRHAVIESHKDGHCFIGVQGFRAALGWLARSWGVRGAGRAIDLLSRPRDPVTRLPCHSIWATPFIKGLISFGVDYGCLSHHHCTTSGPLRQFLTKSGTSSDFLVTMLSDIHIRTGQVHDNY